MRIVCIQQKALDVTRYQKTFKYILELIENAADFNPDLIVLPECSYPAYFIGLDENKTQEAMEDIYKVLNNISQKAKQYNTYIAAGLVLKRGNELLNAGVLFNREGKLVGSTAKCNLWHFDYKMFSQGTSFEVVETEFGKVGLMVCADARAPEIPRILALKGAEMIIDMVNLTASGKDPSQLSNAQCDYMLSTRALENGVWLIVADKVGVEADSIVYTGKSCVINPRGEKLVEASPNKEEIIFTEIDLKTFEKKLPERKPDSYKILTKPIHDLPVYKNMMQPVKVPDTELQASVVQFKYEDLRSYIYKASNFIKTLEEQDVSLVMLPQLNKEDDVELVISQLQKSINNPNTVISLVGYRKIPNGMFKCAALFTKLSILGNYYKTHCSNTSKNLQSNGVIDTPVGRLGVMLDQEGFIPEVARKLMLEGSEIILWHDNYLREKTELVARTRAAENKIFLLRTGVCDICDYSFLIAPTGNLIGSTFRGKDQAASALLVTALSKSKTVVPGTNVVLDRKPELYKELIE